MLARGWPAVVATAVPQTTTHQEAFVSRANALLIPSTRERLARLTVDDGWTAATAAKMFMVSPVTAGKWAARW